MQYGNIALEEAADRVALRASQARGKEGRDDALPASLYRRIRSGEHPIRIWREYRGLGPNELAEKAKIAGGYLSEIENWKKPGGASALRRLADSLGIGLDEVAPRARPAAKQGNRP
jgi:ribosome-binding protein aMBF1 (putative translation factor)